MYVWQIHNVFITLYYTRHESVDAYTIAILWENESPSVDFASNEARMNDIKVSLVRIDT
jgi:hypothetical protein